MNTVDLRLRVRTLNAVLTKAHFYPVALASALALAALAARVLVTRQITFVFLAWNLVLAWVPYALSLVMPPLAPAAPRHANSVAASTRRHAPIIAVGIAWLLFLPNAPYLVTDLVHLRHRAGVPLWFDATMLASFAWAGLALMSASLLRVQRIVERRMNPSAGWIFTVLVLTLSGAGIYMGRFLRWNSWDVLRRPDVIARQSFAALFHPDEHVHAWAFTVFLASTAFAVYLFPAMVASRRSI